MRLIVTGTAKADLHAIHGHIKKESLEAANAFSKDLTEKLFSLAERGATGAPRDWVSTGMRAFPYKNRCFYFRISGDKIYVLRVLPGRQDITAQDFPYMMR